MAAIFQNLSGEVKVAVRSATFTAFGILFCLAGTVFLSVALWQFLAVEISALAASLGLGAIYLIAGLLLLLLAPNRHRDDEEHRRAADENATTFEPFFQMAQGFAAGMQAGRAARSGRG
ncbi:phage holin family protein [Roseovarius sp. CAU 1744]|uniref:phage holin family protein n=1 Tax=Roseovarius sp. CAU 1744 TaxID=3140368 RepID=UPI00325B1BB4